MDLTTLQHVRQLMGADVAAQDGVLQTLLTAVSRRAENWMGREVETKQRTEVFSPDRLQQRFPLKAWPTTVATVIEDWHRAFTGDPISSLYYTVDDYGVLVVDRWTLTEGQRTLQVVHTGGLGTTPADILRDYPDLAHAIALQVSFVWRRKDTLGIAGEVVGPSNITFLDKLDWQPDVLDAMRPYRRWPVG